MATATRTSSLPVPKFVPGEIVLCYEPDHNKAKVLYESKVLEADITKDEKGRKIPEYFIHFNGWNRSWDRWVLEDQVQKNNESNRALMTRLHQQALQFRKKKKLKPVVSEIQEDKDADASSKTGTSQSDKSFGGETPKVQIEIPSQLKLKLENDCYFIKRKKKLLQIPRIPNVEGILEDYCKHAVAAHSDMSATLIREVVDGLRIYFDFTLPTLLLYNFERDQFRTVMKITSDDSPSLSEQPSISAPEQGTEVTNEERNGIVSSSTETVSFTSKATTTMAKAQSDGSENTEESKPERTLRRRPLRSHHVEASQSATVSSTSSSPENKRKACEIEDSSADRPVPASTLPTSVPFPSGLSASPEVMPSQIYGPEHLLRLFVKLPGMLANTNMPDANLTSLLEHIDLLLKYLAERADSLFPEEVYSSSLL